MFSASSIFTTRRRGGVAAAAVTIVGTSATAVFGTAPAGAAVTVAKGGLSLGTATANGSGVWSYTPSAAPAPGDVYTASVPVSSASYTVPPVVISISDSPGPATVGTAYSFTPSTANGSGTKTFSLSGTLPAGLSFSSTTGAVTGTPTTAGTASGLAITVTDATGSATLSGLSIVVGSVSVPVITGTPQAGQTLTASQASTWSVGGVARSFLAASTTYAVVPADVGKTITATSSNGTSAPTAAVTEAALAAASPAIAYGAKVAMLGDSIVQFNVNAPYTRPGDATQGSIASQAKGELGQLVTLDPRYNADNWFSSAIATRLTDGSCQGIAGQTSTQIAARVGDVVARAPALCIVAMGTNNVGQQSTILSDFASTVTALRNAGIAVIVATIRPTAPSGEGARPKATIQSINAAIRSYVAGLGDANVVLWDAYAQMDRGDGYGDPGDFNDGLHLNARGAELSAWGNDPASPSPNSLAAALRRKIQAGSRIADQIAANTNILPNPIFATAAGGTAPSAPVSGTLPASWAMGTQSPTPVSTCVVSAAANAATGGNSVVATITAAGSAALERFQFRPAAFNINNAGLASAWLRCFAEIETDGSLLVGQPNVSIAEIDSGSQFQYAAAFVPDTIAPQLSRGVGRRRLVMSDAVLCAASGPTAFFYAISIPILPNQVPAGTVSVVKIHRVWAAIVSSPKTAWGL